MEIACVQGLKRLWRQVEARGARKTMCRQQLGWPWRHPFILPYRAPRSPQRPIYAHLRSLVRSRLGSTVTPGRSRRVKGPEAAERTPLPRRSAGYPPTARNAFSARSKLAKWRRGRIKWRWRTRAEEGCVGKEGVG